jgi:hypothetical protein
LSVPAADLLSTAGADILTSLGLQLCQQAREHLGTRQ